MHALDHLVRVAGYPAILVLMIAESALVPVPSEVIMLVGGALAATGQLDLWLVVALGTVGNLIGSYIAWGIGRTGGRAAVDRFGRYVLLRHEDLERAEGWFREWGTPAVFVSRMLPVVRTFISLPAGMAEMPALRFGLYTFAGSLIWDLGLAAAGYELGSRWSSIMSWFNGATYLIAAVVAAAVVAFVVSRARRRRGLSGRAAEAGGEPGQ
ncbi:MAG: DedA family protein [Acidimicrobiales bacterium]